MSNPRDISPPPAFQEQIDEARSFGRLVPFLRLISWFGIGGDRLKNLASELKDYEAQVDSLVGLCGSFHNAFSELGWLFSDSTSVETAEKGLSNYLKTVRRQTRRYHSSPQASCKRPRKLDAFLS